MLAERKYTFPVKDVFLLHTAMIAMKRGFSFSKAITEFLIQIPRCNLTVYFDNKNTRIADKYQICDYF